MRIIDLTAPLRADTPVYPGDTPLTVTWISVLTQVGYNLSKVELSPHCGTHVDAPYHFLDSGIPIDQIPLECFAGPAMVIDTPKGPGEEITLEDFRQADIRRNDICLFSTGWEALNGTSAFFNAAFPGLSEAALISLIQKGVKAVGGDFASVDGFGSLANNSPCHRKAAEAGIPIYEGLINLKPLIGHRFLFVGMPLRIEGLEASPVRAIAIVED